MQKKFERGSEKAQMSIDLINEIQNHHITEENEKYWNDVVDSAGIKRVLKYRLFSVILRGKEVRKYGVCN